MHTAEIRKNRTEDLQKFIEWFETFKTRYDEHAKHGAWKRAKMMQETATLLRDIKTGETLGDGYVYKVAQEFIAIAEECRTDTNALLKLRSTIGTAELDRAWCGNHIELHYLTRIEKLLNEWEAKVNKLAKVCNASTIEEIASMSPKYFKKYIKNYMKLWQNPSEDVNFCKEASCAYHNDIHEDAISFMWVIETIRSDGGPEVIKKLMNKYNITVEKFIEVFPDPPKLTEEEKEIAARLTAVDEAWEALQDHKYSGKYQRAYATAREKLDELIQ